MVQIKVYLLILVIYQTHANSQSSSDNFPVPRSCLLCMCNASSGCDTRNHCADICGPFRIKKAYWIDAGKPTLNGESTDSTTAFANCVQDVYCASLAVQGYMARYHQDCNNDGKIDCDDYAMIHKLGGFGCPGKLPEGYKQRYLKCQRVVKYWP